MEIGWILGGFFTFLVIVYVAIVIFIPELVGIQGKRAKKIEESHSGDTDEKNSAR
jgi:hypothetical protein